MTPIVRAFLEYQLDDPRIAELDPNAQPFCMMLASEHRLSLDLGRALRKASEGPRGMPDPLRPPTAASHVPASLYWWKVTDPAAGTPIAQRGGVVQAIGMYAVPLEKAHGFVARGRSVFLPLAEDAVTLAPKGAKVVDVPRQYDKVSNPAASEPSWATTAEVGRVVERHVDHELRAIHAAMLQLEKSLGINFARLLFWTETPAYLPNFVFLWPE